MTPHVHIPDILSRVPVRDRITINGNIYEWAITDRAQSQFELSINGSALRATRYGEFPEDLQRWCEDYAAKAQGKETDVRSDTSDRRSKLYHWYDTVKSHSHSDVADLIASLCCDKLCYCEEVDTWYWYNSLYWCETTDSIIKRSIIECASELSDIADGALHLARYSNTTIQKYHKDAKKYFTSLKNNRSLNDVVSVLKLKLHVPLDTFNKDPLLLNVQDGTIDLRTGQKRPHDPNDFITLYIDIPYCPQYYRSYQKWPEFLRSVLPKRRARHYAQKMAGYILTGKTNADAFFIIYGKRGGTGKSTFIEAIQSVLGSYATSISYATLTTPTILDGGKPREDILRLRDKRMGLCSELQKGMPLDASMIKRASTGDRFAARGLWKKASVEFDIHCKVVLQTNFLPPIPPDEDGIYRRVKIIEFPYKIPEDKVDENLRDEFKTSSEAQKAILSWLVEGALLFTFEGLKDTPEISEARRRYIESVNPLAELIENEFECGVGREYVTSASQMKEIVDYYAEYYNIRVKTSFDKIKEYVTALGFEHKRSNRGNIYKGLCPKATADQLAAKGRADDFSPASYEEVDEFVIAEPDGVVPSLDDLANEIKELPYLGEKKISLYRAVPITSLWDLPGIQCSVCCACEGAGKSETLTGPSGSEKGGENSERSGCTCVCEDALPYVYYLSDAHNNEDTYTPTPSEKDAKRQIAEPKGVLHEGIATCMQGCTSHAQDARPSMDGERCIVRDADETQTALVETIRNLLRDTKKAARPYGPLPISPENLRTAINQQVKRDPKWRDHDVQRCYDELVASDDEMKRIIIECTAGGFDD